MDIINRIANGVHLDNNEYDQPDNTMRDNRNGIIFDLVSGSYVWKNLKGTLEVLELSDSHDVIMRSCWIRDRYFFFVLNSTDDYVQLREILFNTNGTVSSTVVRWQETNTVMKMDVHYPIRAMFGIYENDNIQRIYWSDYNNHPRCINIGSSSLGSPVTPDAKFIELVPELEGDYGYLKFTSEIAGGSLKAGTYFFAWRLYKEGYYTDWSYLTTPVPVFNGLPGSTYADYQAIEGSAPNDTTSKGLQLTLTEIDDEYEKIQVASFYCNDLNSVAEGIIIYENLITTSTIVINYTGGENAGTVTINEIMNVTVVIEKCFDMMHVKKRHIMANLEERAELDIPNQLEVSIIPKQYTILLDTTPYGYHSGTPYVKELYGTKTAALEIATYKLFSQMYHYAVTEIHYHDNTNTGITISAGKYFLTNNLHATPQITGTAKLAIVIKKYRKGTASIPYDLTDDYELDASTVENEYYNYKNPRFTEKLKGYPGGEKIRLGVMFFDKTGRPFFVRHLYNLEEHPNIISPLVIGPGDTRIPDRYSYQASFCDKEVAVAPDYYQNTYGLINYLSVSGIDVTEFKDDIGAFAIVRCPIERVNIAYGVLGQTYEGSNDVRINKCFRGESDDISHFPSVYAFYCPEDIFEMTGFSIQPGDKLVNRYYLNPFYGEGIPEDNGGNPLPLFQGFGDESGSGIGLQYHFHQKFYQQELLLPTTGNGEIDVEHEIIAYTKYRQGDGDEISIDPRDETKLLRYQMYYSGSPYSYYTYLTNVGIVVIDIDEGAGPTYDIKGIFDLAVTSPRMLICSVKRENSNPYGGLGDAALASSLYMSTGHFQIVDAVVLADIKNGNDYIFNEVEIFGGDTFVCIWDFLHTQKNMSLDANQGRWDHSFQLPIETRINLDLREGNHVGRLRCYSVAGGLRWQVGEDKWEEFNYNDGYSSDNPSRLYLPLPNNFTFENIFDTRIRYSNEKTYGEYEDSYRKFSVLDHFTIETNFGPIINIRSKNDNIIYWQKNGVGYIPMGERALTSNDAGNAVQLGVGGIFERYDNILEMIGNSNQFSLVQSDEGFTWYDGIRKLLITLGNGMKITQESIVKGLDSYLISTIPNNIDTLDNPGHDYGVLGGYDPREKMVYMTFRTNGFNETIGISIKENKFVGFFDFKPRLYLSAKDYFYAVGDTFRKLYQFGTGTIGSYFGETKNRYFTIIVKEDSNIAKIFDTFELVGNEHFFNTIDFTLEDASTIKEYYSGATSRHVSQKLGYRNKRWYGNYPRIDRERMVGGYVKITFTDSGSEEIRFVQMKTSIRQMI